METTKKIELLKSELENIKSTNQNEIKKWVESQSSKNQEEMLVKAMYEEIDLKETGGFKYLYEIPYGIGKREIKQEIVEQLQNEIDYLTNLK